MTVLHWDATRQRVNFRQKRLSRLNQDYIFLEGEEKIQGNCFLLEGEEKLEKTQTQTTTTTKFHPVRISPINIEITSDV